MRGETIYAVTDGPDGEEVLAAPAGRDDALRLRADRTFWCSTAGAGCGGELRLHAGPVIRPYFQHIAGTSGCSYANGNTEGHRHLHAKRLLVRWLAGQGLNARAEMRLGPGGQQGRADVHVVVDGLDATIEVQLSPLSERDWRTRDARYRQAAHSVTWLFGSATETIARAVCVARGHSLIFDDVQARMGTQALSRTTFDRLEDCWMTSNGIATPSLQAALAEHSAAELARREAARAEEARREAIRQAEERQRRAREQREWLHASRQQAPPGRAESRPPLAPERRVPLAATQSPDGRAGPARLPWQHFDVHGWLVASGQSAAAAVEAVMEAICAHVVDGADSPGLAAQRVVYYTLELYAGGTVTGLAEDVGVSEAGAAASVAVLTASGRLAAGSVAGQWRRV